MFFGLELQKQKRKALERNGQSKTNFILSWNKKKSTTGHLGACEEKQVPDILLKTFVIREAYPTPFAPIHCDCLSEIILGNK